MMGKNSHSRDRSFTMGVMVAISISSNVNGIGDGPVGDFEEVVS